MLLSKQTNQRLLKISFVLWILNLVSGSVHADELPFGQKLELFRDEQGDTMAFVLRLEQPFFAEEFEQSSQLRLESRDDQAYLIYPTQTKFRQKHAEFYGRLRGQGKANLRLVYETIAENPDGSRQVDTRSGDIVISIPDQEVGPRSIFQEWANRQNQHFLELLRYYPGNTFLEYVLLQSEARYGVQPPRLPQKVGDVKASTGKSLYQAFSGSLALQQTLQRQVLTDGVRVGDHNTHIRLVPLPQLNSLPYEELLAKAKEAGKEPTPSPMARLIPQDYYLATFQQYASLKQLFELSSRWGDSLLRLWRVDAQDNRLLEKLEEQLCLEHAGLGELGADGTIGLVGVTGADPFFHEGTDVTLILKLHNPDAYQAAALGWLDTAKQEHPDLEERAFVYRGLEILARYTGDRSVSAFSLRHGDYAVYSNSPRAIRRIAYCLTNGEPSLFKALDYRYVTTLLPPSDEPEDGYFYGSEAFLKRMIGPSLKISEKRRLQCFNNLIMLNNASLFFRMEHGRSPQSLSELAQGGYIQPDRLTCPHGGAYALDPSRDTCSCSAHNRLRYLTPNAELEVLQVSQQERDAYQVYRQAYQQVWQGAFDPIALRFHAGQRVKLEACILPLPELSLYRDLRDAVADQAKSVSTAGIAPSAVVSLGAVINQEQVASFLRTLPGLPEALEADPTLTDLSWLGERIFFHLCDADTILEIDPLRLRPLSNLPLPTNVGVKEQAIASAIVYALNLPVYVTIDIKDQRKAARLLELLSSKAFLNQGRFITLPAGLDAYRLPEYKGHSWYVLTYQFYALKVRLHVALLGNQLVAATKPGTLREVIDARREDEGTTREAHLLLRLNRNGLNQFRDSLQLYWEEKAREACHGNIISIDTLANLYDTPPGQINRLALTKYGVTYHCPDGGTYGWNDRRAVVCSVHGNRRQSRQNLGLRAESSFARFLSSLQEVVLTLRFEDEALFASVEIARTVGEEASGKPSNQE